MEILRKDMLLICINDFILVDLALLFFNNNKLLSIWLFNSIVVQCVGRIDTMVDFVYAS